MSDVVHEVSYRLWKHGVKGSTAWVPTGFFERGEHSNPPFLSICPYPFSSLSLLSTLVLPSQFPLHHALLSPAQSGPLKSNSMRSGRGKLEEGPLSEFLVVVINIHFSLCAL